MKQNIGSITIQMETTTGKYSATVVDYLQDATYDELELPDHMVSVIPMAFEQLRRLAN